MCLLPTLPTRRMPYDCFLIRTKVFLKLSELQMFSGRGRRWYRSSWSREVKKGSIKGLDLKGLCEKKRYSTLFSETNTTNIALSAGTILKGVNLQHAHHKQHLQRKHNLHFSALWAVYFLCLPNDLARREKTVPCCFSCEPPQLVDTGAEWQIGRNAFVLTFSEVLVGISWLQSPALIGSFSPA